MRPWMVLVGGVLLAVWASLWLWQRPQFQVVAVVGGPDASPEIVSLRSQLETIRRYDDQIVAVTTAAIQVVVVVALALAAFSWYTNNRLYERDLTALRRELDAAVTSAETRVLSAVDARMKALQAEHQKAAAAAATQAVAGVAAKLQDLSDEYWSERALSHDVKASQLFYEKKGAGAFSEQLKAFEASNKEQYGWTRHSDCIDMLTRIVRELGYHPDADELGTVEKCVKGVRAELKPGVEALHRAIEKPGV